MEGMSEEELYAMSQMSGSHVPFAGSYVPQYGEQQISAAPGYSQIAMGDYPGDYSSADNRYLNTHEMQSSSDPCLVIA